MLFQKGKPKTGGRKPGSLNKKTRKKIKIAERIIALCEQNLEEDIMKLSPKDRVKFWDGLHSYTRARLSGSSETAEEIKPKEPDTIVICRHIYNGPDEPTVLVERKEITRI